MSRIMTGLFLALTCGIGMSAQAEVKFIDYDYARFSQDVTECDRLASHGRDPGHVAPAVSSSGMDKPAAIAACQRAVAADPDNPSSTISSDALMAIRVGARRRCPTG